MSPSDVQKFLGLEIGGEVDYKSIWNERKNKLCSAFDFHLRNKYSIYGRVVLARTYTISKLWYSAMFHTPSDAWLKSLSKISENFIFGKPSSQKHNHSFKRGLQYIGRDDDGLAALHPPSQWKAFHLKWIAALFNPSDAKWKCFVSARLYPRDTSLWSLGPYAILTTISLKKLPLSPTWLAFTRTAHKTQFSIKCDPTCISSVLQQPLFFNKNTGNIKSNNFILFTHINIRCIKDIYVKTSIPSPDGSLVLCLNLLPLEVVIHRARVKWYIISDFCIQQRWNHIIQLTAQLRTCVLHYLSRLQSPSSHLDPSRLQPRNSYRSNQHKRK